MAYQEQSDGRGLFWQQYFITDITILKKQTFKFNFIIIVLNSQ